MHMICLHFLFTFASTTSCKNSWWSTSTYKLGGTITSNYVQTEKLWNSIRHQLNWKKGNGDASDSSDLHQWAFDSYFYNSSEKPCALQHVYSIPFSFHSPEPEESILWSAWVIFIRLRYIRKRSFDIDSKLISRTRINFFQLGCHQIVGSDSVNDF